MKRNFRSWWMNSHKSLCQGETDSEGNRDGRVVLFDSEGDLLIRNYTNEIATGQYTQIDSNGKMSRGQMIEGKLVGTWTHIRLDGSIYEDTY